MVRLMLTLALSGAALPALALAEDAGPGCVEVEIAGKKEQSLACLSAKLLPPKPAGRTPPAAPSTAEAIAQRPSNQLGLYNRAATEHRMGNAFGKSVLPQRPATPAPASPLIPAR